MHQWKAAAIAGLLAIPAQIAHANIFDSIPKANIENAIESTTKYLINNWDQDPNLEERPPQVLPLVAGSKVYGACGEYIEGSEVAGSSYCPATRTIYLVPEQLKYFEREFGASAIAYVIAHEFGHAIQQSYKVNIYGPSRELQADCLAGIFIKEGKKELGITRNDVLAMGKAAYSIGSKSHGTGAQRAYALASGMGVTSSSCENKRMQQLADGEVKDPILKKLKQERSGSRGIDTSRTPYPKTVQSALGL